MLLEHNYRRRIFSGRTRGWDSARFVLPAFILRFFIMARITVSLLDSSVLRLDPVSLWINESAR